MRTLVTRGYENSVLIKRGDVVVAEVFTEVEPGDQYKRGREMMFAPEMLEMLEMICHRATRRVPDSTGHDMVSLRAALLEKASDLVKQVKGD